MWRSDVPTARNPMELVSIKGVTKRVRKPRSLSVHEFQLLLEQFERHLRFRAFVLVAVSFGLRISEALGLKWQDVDWLGKTICIQRGVVKQIVGDVKSAHSARTMVCASARCAQVMAAINRVSAEVDWVFASLWKIGRQPICYTFVGSR
jgi:integrase